MTARQNAGLRTSRVTAWLVNLSALLAACGFTTLTFALLLPLARDRFPAGALVAVALIAAVGSITARRARGTEWWRIGRRTLGWTATLVAVFWFTEPATAIGGFTSLAHMRLALHETAAAQNAHRDSTGRYTASVPAPPLRRRMLVERPSIVLTADGWNATVYNEQLGRTCAIYVGATPAPPARIEREVRCTLGPVSPRALLTGAALIVAGLVTAVVGVRLTLVAGDVG